jgi:hypothetical protein
MSTNIEALAFSKADFPANSGCLAIKIVTPIMNAMNANSNIVIPNIFDFLTFRPSAQQAIHKLFIS